MLGCLRLVRSLTGIVFGGVEASLAKATISNGAVVACSVAGGFSVRVPDGESVTHEGLRSETVHVMGAVKSEPSWTCWERGSSELAPIRALKELTNLDFDFNDVFIARNVILSTSSLSLEETAKLLGVTRQTVWNRKKIVIASFESLAGNESFRALTDFALSFRRFPVNEERYEPEFVLEPWEICFDKSEPLIGFLTITPGGLFPNYIDLLQVVFYLTTKPSGPLANESDPPTGLQLGLGPGVNWDEGNQRYLTGRYQEDEIND